MNYVFVDQAELNRAKPTSEKKPIVVLDDKGNIHHAVDVLFTGRARIRYNASGTQIGDDIVRVYVEAESLVIGA